jgi:phosphoribosylamine--glycine ligase
MAASPSWIDIFLRSTTQAYKPPKASLFKLTKLRKMKILILGQGAREHAIVKALIRTGTSPKDILVAPGNKGIAEEVECEPNIDITDRLAVDKLALEQAIELAIIGPEAPLVAGVSDSLRAQGVAVFGPSQVAAQLEGSKSFAKQIMSAAGVPTGMARQCQTMDEVEHAMEDFGAPYVIKADGLAAGKGVIVTEDSKAALEHAKEYIHMGILVEEFLAGQEVSLFFLSDGKSVMPLTPAQDFKRAFDNDKGPNTGGMGAYSPLPWLPENFIQEVEDTVALPTINELTRLGAPFVGLLYCGLIVTERGIRVIEFNARFGDPETQVVLQRLITPLESLLYKASTGHLENASDAQFTQDVAVTVVLASEGYPSSQAPVREVKGIKKAQRVSGVEVCFGSNVGRVLSVVATGKNFKKARKRAYKAISKITLDGAFYRTDIAAKVAQ